MECHEGTKCPQCGYTNQPAAQRCVRCRAALVVPAGCSGACSKCLLPFPETPPEKKT